MSFKQKSEFLAWKSVLGRLTKLNLWADLESDDDESDENVDHEECYDDDVDDVKDCNALTVVPKGSYTLLVWVDAH